MRERLGAVVNGLTTVLETGGMNEELVVCPLRAGVRRVDDSTTSEGGLIGEFGVIELGNFEYY